MNTLIPLHNKTVNAETNSVNARELHSFLKSKSDYSTWIKNRINKYGFIENQDYIIILTKKHGNNATLKEYYITLDMAKELSMVENNDKGREARRYFIEVEKRYKQTDDSNLIGVVLKLVENQQKQTDAILSLVENIKTAPQLSQSVQQTVQYLDSRDRKKLRDAINDKAKEVAKDLGVSVSTISPAIWIELKNFFDVDDYQDIHKEQMKDVMHFVMFWEPRPGSKLNPIPMPEL